MSDAEGWRWKRLDLNAVPEPEGSRRARPVHNAPGTTDMATVVVLDDDDDVQICSPPRQCNLDVQPRPDEQTSQPISGVQEQRPKLPVSRKRSHRQKRVHPATIIDLTVSSDDCEVICERPKKKLNAPSAQAPAPVEAPPKELKLMCAICFDTMKNETSTVCGHLFCAACIAAAIKAQKRCPTCRKKLTNSMVHRIYLGGS